MLKVLELRRWSARRPGVAMTMCGFRESSRAWATMSVGGMREVGLGRWSEAAAVPCPEPPWVPPYPCRQQRCSLSSPEAFPGPGTALRSDRPAPCGHERASLSQIGVLCLPLTPVSINRASCLHLSCSHTLHGSQSPLDKGSDTDRWKPIVAPALSIGWVPEQSMASPTQTGLSSSHVLSNGLDTIVIKARDPSVNHPPDPYPPHPEAGQWPSPLLSASSSVQAFPLAICLLPGLPACPESSPVLSTFHTLSC